MHAAEKQDAALLPLRARKSEDRMQFNLLHDRDDGVRWEWNAAELRAASTALLALADQLDEPRRNAGPGCTFTRNDALACATVMRCCPVAYAGNDGVYVGWADDLHRGSTWWEASAKAGLFGTEIARKMRKPDTERPWAPNIIYPIAPD